MNNIRIPITIGVIVIVLMVNFASLSQTHASLLSLVANGAQDVYLTDAPKIQFDISKLKSDESKLKADIDKLKAEESKVPPEENKPQSTSLLNLVATSSQDVYDLQTDIINLESDEKKLQSYVTELNTMENEFAD